MRLSELPDSGPSLASSTTEDANSTPDSWEERLWGPIPREQELDDLLMKLTLARYPMTNFDDLLHAIHDLRMGLRAGNPTIARQARRFRNHVERCLRHWEVSRHSPSADE